jgi:hypothetical protein
LNKRLSYKKNGEMGSGWIYIYFKIKMEKGFSLLTLW